MPLPTKAQANNEWPPPTIARYTKQQREWAAWWAGDVEKLRNTSGPRRFWGRQAAQEARRGSTNEPQTRAMHAALAADIVSTSADLLFGDPPKLTIPEPEATGDAGETVDATETGVDQGEASLTQEAAAVAVTQARLDEIRDNLALDLLLLEAGEVAAALGGAWLRPAWDTTLTDHPIATVIDPEQAVPEYRMGQLVAVTFWETVGEEGAAGRVWRHLERHEITTVTNEAGETEARGVILHGLYLGDKDKLGAPKGLGEHAATASLPEVVVVPKAAGPIAAKYLPNVLPNRKHRRLPIGRSDFDGIEDTLDALDEVWTSLLRDIRLGVARVFAPEGALERVAPGAGSGRTFDVDRELIIETEVAADENGGKVYLAQGDIRVDGHLRPVDALTRQAVSTAGYSPQTFGLDIDGQAESGTALNVRERKTWRTLERKRGYAGNPLADFALALLAIDAEIFGREIVPMRPRVEWPDVTQDAGQTAQRLQLLRAAQAISVREAVSELHPDWPDTEIDAEVGRIMAEIGTPVPNPDELNADTGAA